MSNEKYIRATQALERCPMGSPDFPRLQRAVDEARSALTAKSAPADDDDAKFDKMVVTGKTLRIIMGVLKDRLNSLQREVTELKARLDDEA